MAHIIYRDGVFFVEMVEVVVSPNLLDYRVLLSIRRVGDECGIIILKFHTSTKLNRLAEKALLDNIEKLITSNEEYLTPLEKLIDLLYEGLDFSVLDIETSLKKTGYSNYYDEMAMEVPIKNVTNGLLKMTSINMYRVGVKMGYIKGNNTLRFVVTDGKTDASVLTYDLESLSLKEDSSLLNQPLISRHKLESMDYEKTMLELKESVELAIKHELLDAFRSGKVVDESALSAFVITVLDEFDLVVKRAY